MTVSSPDNKWSYDGDDAQKIFQYKARIYAARDLLVYLVAAAGVETLQTLDVDYTVDGVLVEAGGNVTFGTAPAEGVAVLIKIELPYTQELALPEAGLLPTGPLEIALDRQLKLSLQLKEQLDRALKFSAGSSMQDMTVPDPEPGKYLIWSPSGDLANAEILSLTDAATVLSEILTYFTDPDNFPAGQDAGKIADGSVANFEFQCLNGIHSNIQGQFDAIEESKFVKVVKTPLIGEVAVGTGIIPLDDTIPEITEGNEFMTLGITPDSAINILKIDVVACVSISAGGIAVIGALFKDAIVNALAGQFLTVSTFNYGLAIKFTYYMVAGTTNLTTFRFRAGPAVANPTTITFNGIASGRLLGGVMASSMTITEIRA